MIEPFLYEMTIREHHLDSFGHVNNAVYLQLFESARWELITLNGYGLEQAKALQRGPVILEATVKFKRELRLRETIRISVVCTSYPKKIGFLEQKIFNAENIVCCEAQFIFGLFDLAARKLIAPTPEWRRAIGG